MNLRRSWVNLPLLKLMLKNNLWPAKVSLLLFSCFYSLTIIVGNNDVGYAYIIVFSLSAVILTIIYPCYLLDYLVNKTKASWVNSLPLSAKTIWLTSYLAGYLLALIPLLIEGGLMILRNNMIKIGYFGDILMTIRFMLTIIIMLFVYYTITFFVCCLSGCRLGQIMFSLMVYGLPLVLLISFVYLSKRLVPISNNNIHDLYYFLLVPLMTGFNFWLGGDGGSIIFIHFVFSLGLFVSSYFVFKNRENEYVGEPLVFHRISVFLKFLLIITMAMMAFCLLNFKLEIDSNYGISGIFLMLVLYLIIGFVCCLIVEMLFNSEHSYRNLLFYLPALIVAFIINYYIGNYRFTSLYQKNYLTSDIYIMSNDDSFTTLSLSAMQTKDLLAYLDNNRDNIYYSDVDNQKIDLYLYLNNTNSYEIFVDYDILIDFFNDGHLEEFKQLFVNEKLTDFSFLDLYYSSQLYLNDDDIKQLSGLIKDIEIEPAVLNNHEIVEFINHGHNYILCLNNQAVDFLMSDKIQRQSLLVDDAYAIFNSIAFDENDDYHYEIKSLLEQYLNTKIQLLYPEYVDSQDGLLTFDEKQAVFQLTYHAVDQANREYTIPIIFVINYEADMMVRMIEVGDNND